MIKSFLGFRKQNKTQREAGFINVWTANGTKEMQRWDQIQAENEKWKNMKLFGFVFIVQDWAHNKKTGIVFLPNVCFHDYIKFDYESKGQTGLTAPALCPFKLPSRALPKFLNFTNPLF